MKRLLIVMVCLVALTGCAPRTKIIEELQLIQALGYDFESDSDFRTVAGSQIILPQVENLPETEVFSAVGNTSRITRKKMQTESSKTLVLGRVNLVLFQDQLAEEGIYYFLDILQRDPVIGRNVRPAVVEGKVYDLLSQNYKLDITVYQYLNELIEQSESEILPQVTLQTLLYHYYDEGSDMYIPMIKQYQDRARVTGLALFKGDQCVHKLSVRESSYLKLLKEPFNGGFYQIDLDNGDYVSLENVDADQDFTIKNTEKGMRVTITVNIKGIINEQGDVKGPNHYNGSALTHLGTEQFEKHLKSLLKTFQELNVDPVGFGANARSKMRDFDIEEWKRAYPDLDIQVKVNLDLISSGITEE
ncbi:Ger(x)C family spore germination protein [Alkalicoccobacillus porphyridii]|uniref:Ger(X)C family spore germination protein n=1 Tax=Alkalicoccobacillus porphyridii TaxID=2597270 RepID=A0A554A0Z2_9BACI|nr:Ger(x)C family spore germination protein [Alkalicoccobacillus porphyridii]TSB47361.1 Ger(x)C family spore germination protein [Alkalicoccobacillus porphyridii]